MIDVSWAHVGVITVGLFVNAGTLAWLVDRRERRQRAAHDKLSEHEKRIGSLEEHHTHTPGWGILNSVKDRLGAIDGDLKAVLANQDAAKGVQSDLKHRVERIESHLLDGRRE